MPRINPSFVRPAIFGPRRAPAIRAALAISAVLCLSGALTGIARAQNAQPLVDENTLQKVSDHVSVLIGFPNIAIIVGDRATLVVDTGLGARNGATVVRVAQKLAKGPTLYLTTTHFHPEHASGAQAFPPNTILIRPTVQQQEMDQHGAEFVTLFSNQSAQNKGLLQDNKMRAPDILFDREMTIDLGGVTARLLWLGPAHTKGDEVIFVPEDSTLIPGDIVQNKLVPNMPGEDASAKGWIAILDQLEALHPRYIVPDHGTLGNGSLIAQERAFLVDIQSRALALKKQGQSADDAAKTIAGEFKTKYPDWTGNGVPNAVKRVYAESQ